jgi:hypothetical protein
VTSGGVGACPEHVITSDSDWQNAPMVQWGDVVLPTDGQRVVIENPRRPERPSGVICSLATGSHLQLLAEAAPTTLAYARRHGWDVVFSNEDLSEARPTSWAKLKLVGELMDVYDFVFWIDADAIIVDLERDILAEVDDTADVWFARHPQNGDLDASVLNAGVFLARSSAFTRALFAEIWRSEQFIDHNWWENAALLHLLGYSLDPPFSQERSSEWQERVGGLDLAWNSVPDYCESPKPALNHHARSDHDNFARRLAKMRADRDATVRRFSSQFATVPRRTHDFTGIAAEWTPTLDDALALLHRLDDDNERQRLRLIEVFDWLETAVTDQVEADLRGEDLAKQLTDLATTADETRLERAGWEARALSAEAELAALRNTKLFRFASPLRTRYARLRGRHA